MSTPSSLRERLGLPAQTRDESPSRSGIPVVLDIRVDAPLARPVGLAKALQRYGVDLGAAHLVLNDLKARSRARVQIYVDDLDEAVSSLEAFGIRSRIRPTGTAL